MALWLSGTCSSRSLPCAWKVTHFSLRARAAPKVFCTPTLRRKMTFCFGGFSASALWSSTVSRCYSRGSKEEKHTTRPPLEELFEVLEQRRDDLRTMPPDVAQRITRSLDRLKAEDLMVGPEMMQRPFLEVGYMDVGQNSDVTLCMFLLKKGASIPLHDHPQMHVFGRLLFGQMRVVSVNLEGAVPVKPMDPGDDARNSGKLRRSRSRQWARVFSSEVYGPAPRTYSLTPDVGNMHTLEAVEDCCFFDVVTPPYNPDESRDITYYRSKKDLWSASVGELCEIQEHWPRHFYTEPIPYKGPRPDAF
ncbi:unnamed protein product [Durusdinium trenchii]|uniref:Cysteine dioxygenase n=1 Tax=Durusdinium trenchii TaxID=1381693 RepID=A0ABP0JMT5_9DINO